VRSHDPGVTGTVHDLVAEAPAERRRAECTPSVVDIDISQAAPARVYDHFLGGLHTFAADRDLAGQLSAAVPDVARMAWANRAFLHRAMCFLVETGIEQFLDLGCGLLTVGSVHDLLHQAAPQARVVHVDLDPITVAYASQAILTAGRAERAAAVCADVRYPWAILSHRDVQRQLDFHQPIGVLAAAVLHYLSDEDKPFAVLAEYRDATVAGSYLAVSHVTADSRPADVASLVGVAARFGIPVTPRSRGQIRQMLAGFDPVDPGLVWAPEWRPDRTGDADIDNTSEPDPSRSCVLAGIGRKP
jgi:S-adenosyl methyltransferase